MSKSYQHDEKIECFTEIRKIIHLLNEINVMNEKVELAKLDKMRLIRTKRVINRDDKTAGIQLCNKKITRYSKLKSVAIKALKEKLDDSDNILDRLPDYIEEMMVP